MERTITVKSSSHLTDFVLMLSAAICRVLMTILEVSTLLYKAARKEMESEDLTFAEMLVVVLIGMFVTSVINLLGFLA